MLSDKFEYNTPKLYKNNSTLKFREKFNVLYFVDDFNYFVFKQMLLCDISLER